MSAVAFELPADLSASAPPERRDGVRLLVARPDGVRHARFTDLGKHLAPGDLVVVNTSGALPAAVDGTRADGSLPADGPGGSDGPGGDDGDPAVVVHFATALDDGDWVVEVRAAGATATGPVANLRPGERIWLPHGVRLTVREPFPAGQRRLWRASVPVDGGVVPYLWHVGRPIRYAYVPESQPIEAYRTVFGRDPGSAEMPSAGRPFSTDLVTDLVTRGVLVAPVLLHTGVSSQEPGEPPQAERFHVGAATARLVNATRRWGGRVVAVGTTVTRALESAAGPDGTVWPVSGWTDLVLGPDRPARVVTGLITGWHAPGASHLDLLEAVAGQDLVATAYREAVRERYLWHEFGDSCLLLP
ncbi:S-adenosylmethionine:tRNA ribosyltransferase-isomerase [Frankia sp. CNm7]|uniref:S-adenosylmethionine:tRNA ribosyltransferase-isomerase n=1 Tax=Frankia nepalensis TaxID=1836974 RepID=A0A937RIP7_9ACTN|nr:S-adenosylmethionine:tRNA ribosyltransferase-isomerase [Frankia nepalensis]MBL7501295.1 S-adenosylmethionine:tRNA ribosyltransferase-isomerase [Frankia nepalensis]MBL7510142.1 S-adenosylmethionine:tRNA ribosyltransferase-isomerase [Frankia nepalensis]MBL7520287.1 S-adenosylmethionine:tRNA ribosyltransferase-isomerase [Frankia nepalensis]MBL7627083.1 S-adenosylmethionine:tRNA ribosyltransferase-isomerase [Frankia nepalensis]